MAHNTHRIQPLHHILLPNDLWKCCYCTKQSTSHHLEPSHTTPATQMHVYTKNALTDNRTNTEPVLPVVACDWTSAQTHSTKCKHLIKCYRCLCTGKPIFWWRVHQNHDQQQHRARWHSRHTSAQWNRLHINFTTLNPDGGQIFQIKRLTESACSYIHNKRFHPVASIHWIQFIHTDTSRHCIIHQSKTLWHTSARWCCSVYSAEAHFLFMAISTFA